MVLHTSNRKLSSICGSSAVYRSTKWRASAGRSELTWSAWARSRALRPQGIGGWPGGLTVKALDAARGGKAATTGSRLLGKAAGGPGKAAASIKRWRFARLTKFPYTSGAGPGGAGGAAGAGAGAFISAGPYPWLIAHKDSRCASNSGSLSRAMLPMLVARCPLTVARGSKEADRRRAQCPHGLWGQKTRATLVFRRF